MTEHLKIAKVYVDKWAAKSFGQNVFFIFAEM